MDASLAIALIPLIPGLIASILPIVDALKDHSDTPDEEKVKLERLSYSLKAVLASVQSVELPDA